MSSSTVVFDAFGEPMKRFIVSEGVLTMWSALPFLVTHVRGYATALMAQKIDALYKQSFPEADDLVTIHDWSELTGFDAECRKIIQQLTHTMRPKQREIIIHLGPAAGIGQKIVQTTAETISRFKQMPIEVLNDDLLFDKRIKALLKKYRCAQPEAPPVLCQAH